MADAPKKLSTQEILAAARAERAKAKGETLPPAAAAPETPAADSAPAPKSVPPKPVAPKMAAAGAAPKTTAEILAAARAAAGKGVAPPSPSSGEAPPPKPSPTAELLAAARSWPEKPDAAAPKAAAGSPKSTADILAAARAQAGKGKGAATEKSPDKPAANKPAADKPAPAKAAGKGKAVVAPAASADGLSVEQMLAAVRPTPVAAKVLPPKPAVSPLAPPIPARPASARKVEAPRRNILVMLVATPFALAWTLLAGWAAAATLMTARFMLPNVLAEPPRKFKIGPPTDYDLGTVSTKWVAANGVWIVHTDQYQGKNQIYALASVCTHLGCTPSWLESEQKFKCPCHGSGFYITGINFEGPAPRPLERVGLRRAEDGMLEVDKSLKFQEEMGQWLDGNSFVEVA